MFTSFFCTCLALVFLFFDKLPLSLEFRIIVAGLYFSVAALHKFVQVYYETHAIEVEQKDDGTIVVKQ